MKTIAQQIKWDFERNGNLEILDKNGNKIYWETSKGYWWNYQDRTIYGLDDSVTDNRPKSSPELTLESLAEQVSKLNEIVTRFVNKE